MSQAQRFPDFFIVGAPKCGTTAMSEYLRSHPNICFSNPKEPHFLASDFPQFHVVSSMDAYLRLFARCDRQNQIAGEGSVWYLYSDSALQAIREHNAAARLIVMLRDPVDFLRSYHGHLCYDFTEDKRDFEEAWALQADRRRGERLPPRCRSPVSLQYERMARFGDHIARMLEIFPRDQVTFILYEDFKAAPREVYRQTLRFLGLQDDGREDFPTINAARVHRSSTVGRLILQPPDTLRWGWRQLKRLCGPQIVESTQRILSATGRSERRPPFAAHVERMLRPHFAADIRKLEGLIGRDLRKWPSHPAICGPEQGAAQP